MSSSITLAALNHLCPPPRLPGKREHNLDEIEAYLTDRLASAVRRLQEWTQEDSGSAINWAQLSTVVQRSKELNVDCRLNRPLLVHELENLDPGGFLILHIIQQNAGIIIFRENHPKHGDIVQFEVFEVSATAASVLSSKGPLVREFPGNTVAMAFEDFQDQDFVDTLASFCEQVSEETIHKFAAIARKAGTELTEVRNTANPTVVTQIFTTIVEALGHRLSYTSLTKTVHDDVFWGEGKGICPWRRSAWWLVLRVGVQRFLQRQYGVERGWVIYKLISCVIIQEFLIDVRHFAHPEETSLVVKKLSRRLAKLEQRQKKLSKTAGNELGRLFRVIEPEMLSTLDETNHMVRDAWEDFKEKTQKRFPHVPRRAKEKDLILDLSNSMPYLRHIVRVPPTEPDGKTINIEPKLLKLQGEQSDFNLYYSIAHMEANIRDFLSSNRSAGQISTKHLKKQCSQVAGMIQSYIEGTAWNYRDDSEQLSRVILLVMELWVLFDQYVIKLYPLVQNYPPPFTAAMLDVLELQFHEQMLRLQKVQLYLSQRHNQIHVPLTIFASPSKGCLADAFFQNSRELHDLHESITKMDNQLKSAKEKEWNSKNQMYRSLTSQLVEMEHRYSNKIHDKANCTRCSLEKQQRKVKIMIQENSLQSSSRDLYQAKAVVFELLCPSEFAQYRDATWSIIRHFDVFGISDRAKPLITLPEFAPLQKFKKGTHPRITLASLKKPFQKTHYKRKKFPVEVIEVCVDHGCEYSYFDTKSRNWTDIEGQIPRIAHHFRLKIPEGSPYVEVLNCVGLEADSTGFTSNEAVACQTTCPRSLSIHEWTAFHSVSSNFSRRWYSILIELGASNLNFSSETVVSALSRLALQAGPNPNREVLRQSHHMFEEKDFCKQLAEQINKRLTSIEPNRREVSSMSLYSKLTLHLRSLSRGLEEIENHTSSLLAKIRRICSEWLRALKQEKQAALDLEASKAISMYALRTALILRGTFITFTEDQSSPDTLSLCQFFEASLSLQENLVLNVKNLPRHLQNAFSNDVNNIYRYASHLRRSLEANPQSIIEAIETVWEGSLSSINVKSWSFMAQPRQWWIQIIVQGEESFDDQTVHFHILHGILLIDGQKFGALPQEHGQSDMVRELFGDQNLMAMPSNLKGMQYMIWPPIKKHRIHLGYRKGNQIIRAWNSQDRILMELVPKTIFLGQDSFDLPAPLIENCVHWYFISSGEIHIRERPYIWTTRMGNWILDIKKRQASRRRSQLVNPNSLLFRNLAKIFTDFEESRHMVAFQPDNVLQIQLPRLKLSFRSAAGLLYCYELKAEIDPIQDVGTWYGLASKLILRSTEHHQRRHVLVPLGVAQFERMGIHVKVKIPNSGDYGRYTINTVLGRMDCPQLPILLYHKAMLHAYTSFILPDSLTGRTGTEEALHCLKQGQCQPWQPLKESYQRILAQISSLSPERYYYPPTMKEMQVANFNDKLTTSMQYDELALAVQPILDQSLQLEAFYGVETQPDEVSMDCLHLRKRALNLKMRYQRSDAGNTMYEVPSKEYSSRDKIDKSESRRRVFEVVSILRHRPSELNVEPNLRSFLESVPFLVGYNRPFNPVSFAECFSVDIGSFWGQLVRSCLESTEKEKHRLMFLFASLSFDRDVDMKVIRTILSFAIQDSLKALVPPVWEIYNSFRYREIPNRETLKTLVELHSISFEESLENIMSQKSNKAAKKAAKRRWKNKQNDESQALTDFVTAQWPCKTLEIYGVPEANTINVYGLLGAVQKAWGRFHVNYDHSEYLDSVRGVLLRHCCHSNSGCLSLPSIQDVMRLKSPKRFALPTLTQFMESDDEKLAGRLEGHPQRQSFADNPLEGAYKVDAFDSSKETSEEIRELKSLVSKFGDSNTELSSRYSTDLLRSVHALGNIHDPWQNHSSFPDTCVSDETLTQCKFDAQNSFLKFIDAFETSVPATKWLKRGDMLPCFTPRSLLEHLRSTSKHNFGLGMKEALIEYGLLITRLQKALRILDASDTQRLKAELDNPGHTGWNPLNYPDWLLIEIDADILIRQDQAEVAFATIRPQSASNSLTQLQMGRGKTSCILPMVAAVLANSKQLLRLVLPKPLLLQTAQVMQSRLGGLVGRQVRHIPFSRRSQTEHSFIRRFMELHKNIMDNQGVMVAVPEHIMSFQLSGFQKISDGKLIEATPIIKGQEWFEKTCRDVLDESDQILSTRTQLIYPSGSQLAVDGHPWRWEVAENFLDLARMRLPQVKDKYPHGIEVVQKHSTNYPSVFFLHTEAEFELSRLLATDMLQGRLKLFPAHKCSFEELRAIEEYVTVVKVPEITCNMIDRLFPDNPAARTALHLSRGLLVHGVLVLCLKKRHNVTYGLHPYRDPVAVPFLAKGIPSPTAEWGHTDVSILLTILSFYYGGLRESQLKDAFDNLIKSDDPSGRYDRWVQSSADMPVSLRHWNAINADDEVQLHEIWQYFKLSTVVIDDYLNSLVFPRCARQFDTRIQNSGWDLLLPNAPCDLPYGNDVFHSTALSSKELAKPLTTGFSGTNDNRYLLPLNVAQTDLPGLAHTNAEVLSYLLQPRNREYIVASNDSGLHLNEIALLQLLESRKISILIDAGAQISEHSNLDLAKAWLMIAKFAQAAAYFDESNNLFVIYRNSDKIVPFSTSPFAENMASCLMYFDQAHTRGVDVRLPADARAALTLALDLTKDDTVQAAMRLRQLASTQSIVWISPPEVHKSILDLQKKQPGSELDSQDVITWLLTQTCKFLGSMQPLFYSQGVDYCRKQQAICENPGFLKDPEQRRRLLESIRQVERQTLQKMYGVQNIPSYDLSPVGENSPLRPYADELMRLREAISRSGSFAPINTFSEVEQERETQQEVERVREVQRPTYSEPYPAPHKLDSNVYSFIISGTWNKKNRSIEPAFDFLGRTDIAREHDLVRAATSERLFVSPEFKRTVRTLDVADMFIRPVNWILLDEECTAAVIVSPDEAELLISLIRGFKPTRTHLLLYAAPVTKGMSHFFNMKYMAIPGLPEGWRAPRWLSVELGIFAGRLYFDYDEYSDICVFLGLKPGEDSVASDENGVGGEKRQQIVETGGPKGFISKPLSFLQAWLDLRRKGSDFNHTPMGYIAQGKLLTPDHPFFRSENQYEVAKLRNDDEESDGPEAVQDGKQIEDDEGEIAW